MTTVIVLFNLKSGAVRDDYENWARARDLPTVNALESVERFEVLRSTGLLVGDGQPPYQYVEIIRIHDMQAFGTEAADEAVQKVVAEFGQFAEAPVFILTEAL